MYVVSRLSPANLHRAQHWDTGVKTPAQSFSQTQAFFPLGHRVKSMYIHVHVNVVNTTKYNVLVVSNSEKSAIVDWALAQIFMYIFLKIYNVCLSHEITVASGLLEEPIL
jgi:hypothetical protein